MNDTAIGVDIDGRKVIIVVLRMEAGEIKDLTGTYKPLTLQEDNNAANVILFRNALHATFESYNPNEILIKTRNPNGKGSYAPSPISFKVEGIIQTYEKCNVCMVAPQTIAAFFKKNTATLAPKFGYQADAFNLAYYSLNSSKK